MDSTPVATRNAKSSAKRRVSFWRPLLTRNELRTRWHGRFEHYVTFGPSRRLPGPTIQKPCKNAQIFQLTHQTDRSSRTTSSSEAHRNLNSSIWAMFSKRNSPANRALANLSAVTKGYRFGSLGSPQCSDIVPCKGCYNPVREGDKCLICGTKNWR